MKLTDGLKRLGQFAKEVGGRTADFVGRKALTGVLAGTAVFGVASQAQAKSPAPVVDTKANKDFHPGLGLSLSDAMKPVVVESREEVKVAVKPERIGFGPYSVSKTILNPPPIPETDSSLQAPMVASNLPVAVTDDADFLDLVDAEVKKQPPTTPKPKAKDKGDKGEHSTPPPPIPPNVEAPATPEPIAIPPTAHATTGSLADQWSIEMSEIEGDIPEINPDYVIPVDDEDADVVMELDLNNPDVMIVGDTEFGGPEEEEVEEIDTDDPQFGFVVLDDVTCEPKSPQPCDVMDACTEEWNRMIDEFECAPHQVGEPVVAKMEASREKELADYRALLLSLLAGLMIGGYTYHSIRREYEAYQKEWERNVERWAFMDKSIVEDEAAETHSTMPRVTPPEMPGVGFQTLEAVKDAKPLPFYIEHINGRILHFEALYDALAQANTQVAELKAELLELGLPSDDVSGASLSAGLINGVHRAVENYHSETSIPNAEQLNDQLSIILPALKTALEAARQSKSVLESRLAKSRLEKMGKVEEILDADGKRVGIRYFPHVSIHQVDSHQGLKDAQAAAIHDDTWLKTKVEMTLGDALDRQIPDARAANSELSDAVIKAIASRGIEPNRVVGEGKYEY